MALDTLLTKLDKLIEFLEEKVTFSAESVTVVNPTRNRVIESLRELGWKDETSLYKHFDDEDFKVVAVYGAPKENAHGNRYFFMACDSVDGKEQSDSFHRNLDTDDDDSTILALYYDRLANLILNDSSVAWELKPGYKLGAHGGISKS